MTRSTTVRRGGAALGLTAAALAVATAFSGAAQAAEATWTLLPTPADAPLPNAMLNDLAVLADDDAWAVGGIAGTGGQALHWDGTAWTATALPANSYLYDVEATGDGTVWATGVTFNNMTGVDTPLALTWDGSAWTEVKIPFPQAGDSFTYGDAEFGEDGQVWIAGARYRDTVANPYLLHFDGHDWEQIKRDIPEGSVDAFFTETTEVDGTLYLFGWKKDPDPVTGWYVARKFLQAESDGVWTDLPLPDDEGYGGWITDMAVDPVSGRLTAAGHQLGEGDQSARPTLFTWDGAAWTPIALPDLDMGVNALAFDGEGRAVLSGEGRGDLHPHILYTDGGEWTEVKSPWGNEIGGYLTDIAFLPSGDLFVVGGVPMESGRPNGNLLALGSIS